MGFTLFNKVFTFLNCSTFIPRKDQCNTCISAKMGNITPEVHKKYLDLKYKARAPKKMNRQKSSKNPSISKYICMAMDTQSMMLCPQSKANAFSTELNCRSTTLLYSIRTQKMDTVICGMKLTAASPVKFLPTSSICT